MTDAVFITLIISMTVVILVAGLILLRKLRPKNRRESDVSGGVSLSDPLLSLTGEITGKKNYHTGTLVINNNIDRIKVSIYNCTTNTDKIVYISTELRIGRIPEQFPHDPTAYKIENDSMVSGIHCILANYAGGLVIRDNNSRNHTYRNGNMVTGVEYIADGDRLHIGNTDLVIRILI